MYYEKWRETKEQRLLDQIEAYNRFDCDSTRGLHEWLLRLRAPDLAWFTGRELRGQTPLLSDRGIDLRCPLHQMRGPGDRRDPFTAR